MKTTSNIPSKKMKRTKTAYAGLYDNPQALFPGVDMLMWPNGEPEIWFKDKRGYGFRVRVSSGPVGLGMTVSRFTATPGLTLNGNQNDGDMTCYSGPDMYEVSLTQYMPDEYSQAFRRWYQADMGEREHGVKHPSEMGLKPHGAGSDNGAEQALAEEIV
jgi:hypothetical protein